MTSPPDPRHEAYAGAITNHLPGNPEQVDAATAAVMALADRDRQLAVWALQGLLTAFPADLSPGGPAVRSRLLPAGLVYRWKQTAGAGAGDQWRQVKAEIDRLTAELEDAETRADGFRTERDQARAALDRVRALHRPADYRGTRICVECSGYDGESCGNSPRGYEHCPTLAALDTDQPKEK